MGDDEKTDYLRHEWPVFTKAPVLVVMLGGWIDAGAAGAAAMATLEMQLAARPLATFNPDLFIDYRARRPVMELREGVNTRVVWPEIVLKVGRDDRGRDVVMLTGHEPDSNWQRFTRSVMTLVDQLGVQTMVGLGAYPFSTPHTRPSRLSLSCSSEEVAATLPFLRNSVDVPAGIQAVIERGFGERTKTAIGLWAQVPHYVANMPYPAAAASLLRGLEQVAGIGCDVSALDQDAIGHQTRVDELIAANEEHLAMLRQLESVYDSESRNALNAAPPIVDSDIPSADELAAELERFLREQGR
jgi:hypothetical protein